jgi:hypothetical protein
MGTITYTAKREIEPTGYLKTGVDISAAPADDSFNASSTTLTGLLADQWLTAAGFASAANNGWFQAKSNSTSGKIIQTTPPISHLRLPGVSGNYASTLDSAANSVTGSIELMAKVAPNDWTRTTENALINKNSGAPNVSYAFHVETGSTGKLVFYYTTDGSTTTGRIAVSTVAVPFADGAIGWVKVTYNAGTGVVQFFTSTNGSSFSQLGTDVTITAGAIHDGSAGLEVGSIGTAAVLDGRIHYAEVRNGIGGTVVASFDPTLATRGAASFASATGETWTINQTGTPPAELQGRALVTAAAGPVVTLTGYKRGLGQSYSLEPQFEQAERSVKMKRNEVQPLADVPPEVLLHRRETHFEMLTDILTEAELPQWREFLASVAAGESFTLDRYGTLAAPVEARQAVLASDDYSEKRLGGQLYRIAFSARVF